jgi:hypothetical protein
MEIVCIERKSTWAKFAFNFRAGSFHSGTLGMRSFGGEVLFKNEGEAIF